MNPHARYITAYTLPKVSPNGHRTSYEMKPMEESCFQVRRCLNLIPRCAAWTS